MTKEGSKEVDLVPDRVESAEGIASAGVHIPTETELVFSEVDSTEAFHVPGSIREHTDVSDKIQTHPQPEIFILEGPIKVIVLGIVNRRTPVDDPALGPEPIS
jgi:hypothetical protein